MKRSLSSSHTLRVAQTAFGAVLYVAGLTLAGLGAPATALAQTSSGGATAPETDRRWYATATGGLTTQSDQELRYTRPGAGESTARLPLDTGFLSGGAIGRYFGSAWRVEVEFAYQSVDHPSFSLGLGGPSGAGNYASTSVAVNALRELDLFGSPKVRTYLGLGAVYLTEVDVDFEADDVESSFSGSDSGVQLLLGARYQLGERAFLDAGLRYLLASGVELEGEEGAPGTVRADYEPLALTVSFGWRF
jgi:opacity protein-like surface antigen